MQNGYRLQWYGIFPPFLIQYLPQLGLLIYYNIFFKKKWGGGREMTREEMVLGAKQLGHVGRND